MGLYEYLRGTLENIFQINGTGGPNLKGIAGPILEMRDENDAAYIITRGADPVGNNDYVTKQYLEAAASLQAAYDAGNTILSSSAEGGAVAITTTVDEVDSGLTVTAGNHTVATAQDLVVFTGVADQTGAIESLVNPGTGSAIAVTASGAASAVAQINIDFGSTTYTSGTAGPDGIRIDYGTADLSGTSFPVGFTLDMASATIGAGTTFSYGMWLRGTTGTGSTETYGLSVGGFGSNFDVGIVLNTGSSIWMVDQAPILFGTQGGTAKTAGDLELVYDPTAVGKGSGVYLREVTAKPAGGGAGNGLIVEAQRGGDASGAINAGIGGGVNIALGDGGDASTGTGNSGIGGGFIVTGGKGGDADSTLPENAARGSNISLVSGRGGAGSGAGLAGDGGSYTARGGLGGDGTATVAGGTGGALILDAGPGGSDGGAGAGAEGAVSLGATFASSVTVGGAQSGAVSAETASGNNSPVLALNQLGASGESVAVFTGTSDPNALVSAEAGSLFLRDTGAGAEAYLNTSAGSGNTWSQLGTGGSGITAAQHAALRQLIHFLDDGPGAGFASGAYKQTAYSGALITQEIWWEDNTLTQKIVQLDVTYTGSLPTTEVWQMFDTDGITVLVTLTDVITYNGGLEITRTRTWV